MAILLPSHCIISESGKQLSGKNGIAQTNPRGCMLSILPKLKLSIGLLGKLSETGWSFTKTGHVEKLRLFYRI